MASTEQILTHCRKLVTELGYRKEYLAGLKGRCHGIAGYFSNYIPQEVIAAAGFHPLRIIGSFEVGATHQHALFNPVCSFVQDVYAAARSGEFSVLDKIIFPNSCDSLKLLRQMWDDEIKPPPAFTLLHPVRIDDASIQYFAEQIRQFAGVMKETGGVNFTEADLCREIRHYNETRGLLRRLYQIRKTDNTFLTGSDTVALVTAGLIMDRQEYRRLLEAIVQRSQQQPSQVQGGLKNLMIIGPLVDNIELLKQIEQQGACIIDDDITNGSRYFDGDVQTQGDPYTCLAERYLHAAPSPTLYTDPNAELQAFKDRVAELNPDDVLFIIQKFCEPHIHNYLSKAEVLRQMNIPVLMLEVEHGRDNPVPADLLRIESFLEMSSRR